MSWRELRCASKDGAWRNGSSESRRRVGEETSRGQSLGVKSEENEGWVLRVGTWHGTGTAEDQ